MTLCVLLLLLSPDDLPLSLSEPEPAAPEARDTLFLRVRGGAWTTSAFRFDATTTASTEMTSRQKTLGSGGLDAGASLLSDRLVLFGGIDGSFASHLRLETGGICLGVRDWSDPAAVAGVPQEGMIYAGPIYGRFDVTTPGFIDFDRAWGARAGISFTWKPGRTLGLTLVAEYRYIKFQVRDKSEIASGNTSVGGSGLWAGLGLDFRF